MTPDPNSAVLVANPRLDLALAKGFEATLQPELWPEVAEDLGRALGGVAFCCHYFGAGESRSKLPASSRYRELLVEFLEDGWSEHDLRSKRGWPMVQAGRPIILEDDVSTEYERAHSSIYQELFARHDLPYFGGMGFVTEGKAWAANVLRTKKGGAFDANGVAVLAAARPYIARMVEFAERMADAELIGALRALECASKPALLLDGQGKVKLMNKPAQDIIGDGLHIRRGRLVSTDAEADARLQTITDRAGGSTKTPLVCAPFPVRREGRPPLIVEAVRTQGALAEAIGTRTTLLLINDLAQRAPTPRQLLRSAFSLTRREAEIAQRMGCGETAEEIAAATGLRISSVRQVVKSLLTKTQSRRKTDLVAILSRMSNASIGDG